MATLQLKNIKKSYGSETTIDNLNLDIHSGEFIVLVGPSGCGKSTLLRMIAGLEEVTAGDVYIENDIVNDLPAGQRGLSMVFQSYALYPHMTVRENLAFGLKNLKVPKEEIEKQIQKASEILQLEELLDRLPQNLSGGQRQRVAIGRSIVQQPKIFLFDEPLSNLDASLRLQMRQQISLLHSQLQNTMIYVTHDQVEAMTLADRIVILNKGNIEQIGTPIEIYNQPKNLFVAQFIGTPTINILKAEVCQEDSKIFLKLDDKVKFEFNHFDLGAYIGQQVSIGIRPEHVRYLESNDYTFEVDVEFSELQGDSTLIYALLGEQKIKLKSTKQLSFKKGDSLTFGVNQEHFLIFDNEGNNINL